MTGTGRNWTERLRTARTTNGLLEARPTNNLSDLPSYSVLSFRAKGLNVLYGTYEYLYFKAYTEYEFEPMFVFGVYSQRYDLWFNKARRLLSAPFMADLV